MGKINDIQNISIENTNVVIRQVASNQKLSDKVTKANISEYNTQVIHELETDWELWSLQIRDEVGLLSVQFISFEVMFENFDERLIPYISTILVYKQVGDEINYFSGYDVWTTSKMFEVQDIEGSNLKQVRVLTTIHFNDGFVAELPYHEAKLIVSVFNPKDFWRIH